MMFLNSAISLLFKIQVKLGFLFSRSIRNTACSETYGYYSMRVMVKGSFQGNTVTCKRPMTGKRKSPIKWSFHQF